MYRNQRLRSDPENCERCIRSTGLNRLLAGFAGWLMVAKMLLLVTDIVFRTGNRPLHGLAEMSVFVMMVVIYLSFSRARTVSGTRQAEYQWFGLLTLRSRRLLAAAPQVALAVATVGHDVRRVGRRMDAWSAYMTGTRLTGLPQPGVDERDQVHHGPRPDTVRARSPPST